jgi:subtilisin
MYRKIVSAVLLVLLYALMASTYAQEDQSPSIPIEDYEEIEALLAADDTLRVIVGLDTVAYMPEGQLSGRSTIQSQRIQIAQTQTRLLDSLGITEDATSVTKFRTIPFMAIMVNDAQLQQLQASTLVTSITLNQRVYPMLQESIPLIGADVTAANGLTGVGQAVAILDTGVDSNHPFFEGRVTHEACFSTDEFPYVTNCPNGMNEQYGPGAAQACEGRQGCFHGTHVAGIAAGRSEARQMRGVAPDADIVGVQVFSGISSWYCLVAPNVCNSVTASFEDVVRGLEYVYTLSVDEGVPIAAANMSLGTLDRYVGECPGVSPALDALVTNLRSVGVATVVATGNSGFTDGVSWPSCVPGIITVGASDNDDVVAEFSNSGPILDLLAPGVEIGSAVPPGTNPDDETTIYAATSGTSMAAPHVAGAWAVLKQVAPEASVDEILMALQTSGVLITDNRNGLVQPRIQVDAAVAALQGGLPPRYRLLVNEIKLEDTQAIEIYNADTTTAVLAGWSVLLYSDNSSEYTYTFPANFSLGAGQYVVLQRGTGTNTATMLYMGDFNSTWASSDGGAVLLRNSLVGVDFARWGSSTIRPVVGTTWVGNDPAKPQMGFSLGRDRDHTDTDDGEDWFDNVPTLVEQNDTDRPPSTDPDDFEGARVVDVIPYADAMTTAQATAAPDDPDSPCYQPPIQTGERINRSVWYRYTATEDRDLTFSTAGTDYGTIMSIWTGTQDDLQLVACHEDVIGFPTYEDVTSLINLRVRAGTTYHIMISAGALLGQTGSSLMFSVTNAPTSLLANDDFDDAVVINDLDYTVEMNVTGSTTAGDDPAPPCYVPVLGNQINNTVWFRYTAPRDQILMWDTTGSGYGTIMSIWSGERGALQSVDCHESGWDILDDETSPNARIELDAQGGTTYHIMISAGGFLGIDEGNLVLSVVDNSPPNRPPAVIAPPIQNQAEAQAVNLQINASDPDNDVLTYIASNLPPGIEINPQTGLISGTLSYNAAGTHTSSITVIDSGLLEAVTTFDWVVQNTNRAPSVEAIANQTDIEGTDIDLQVLASDPDYDDLLYSAADLPDGLSIDSTTGLINGTLTSVSSGNYDVTVNVTDNGIPDAESTMILFLWHVMDEDSEDNVAPYARSDNYAVTINTSLTISAPGILDNDEDVDSPVITASLVKDVINGTLTLYADGAFVYTPNADFTGSDEFVYQATDGELNSQPATVTITVDTPGKRLHPADDTVLTVANALSWPAFMFMHIDGAESYYMWIGNDQSTGLQGWFAAADICDMSTMVCTLPDDVWLPNGAYIWWMTYYGPKNQDHSAYWNETTFDVDFAAPDAGLNNVTPSGTVDTAPTAITWTQDNKALWYHIWLGQVSGPEGDAHTAFYSWVDATTICDAGVCTLNISDGDFPEGDYELWGEVWGPGGYLNWMNMSNPVRFRVDYEPPSSELSNVTPSGTVDTPPTVVTWAADTNTAWYHIWLGQVVGPDGSPHTAFYGWVEAATICDTTICTLDVSSGAFPGGEYQLWIEKWGSGGHLTWTDIPSNPTTFTVDTGG